AALARHRPVPAADARQRRAVGGARRPRLPPRLDRRLADPRGDQLPQEAGELSELVVSRTRFAPRSHPKGGGLVVVERNAMVYRRTWLLLVSGFFEPLFYLFALGVGLGSLVKTVPGTNLSYAAYVAPALLASSAMNGAFYDATNVFCKLRYAKVYEAMLS